MAIYTKLMPHQIQILDFIKDKKYFGIFSDYGTGKSLCALSFINFHHIRKTLIISTKTSIEATWPAEIKKHTDFKCAILIGTRKQKLETMYRSLQYSLVSANAYHGEHSTPTIFLVNFDGVKNIFNELCQANFDLIVVDESTKIKSPKALRTKVLWALSPHVDKRCIMTGFPITENILEIYSQIKMLDSGETFGNSFYAFLDHYFTKQGFRYAPKKKGVIEILNKIKPFCIRVSADVLKLPPKIYKKIELEQTEQQIELIDSLKTTFRLEFGKVSIDTQYIFALINKCLQICDGFITDKEGNLEGIQTNKDFALLELVEEINPNKNKILIWFNYIFSLKKVERLLTKMGYSVSTLFGETEDVADVVNQFQHGKSNILLATQKKASASITLTNCRYAIYYSTHWSADERGNSEARIYRKGTEKHESVFYTDLVIKGTIAEDVIDCLQNKKNLITELKHHFGAINV